MGLKTELTVNKFASHCLFWQNYCSIRINLFENEIKCMLANNNNNNSNNNNNNMNLYDKFTFNRNQIGLFPNNVLFGNFNLFLPISNALATSNNTLKRNISTQTKALFFILHNGIFTFFSKELNSVQLNKNNTYSTQKHNKSWASLYSGIGLKFRQNSYERYKIAFTTIVFVREFIVFLILQIVQSLLQNFFIAQ